MAQRDLIVSFLSGVTNDVRQLYDGPTLYLQSPVAQTPAAGYPGGRAGYQQWLGKYKGSDGRVIPGMFRAAGGKSGDTIGRVCVMGFSNGCIGVDEVLRAPDSYRIDTVLAVDGIHGGYVYKDGEKRLHPPSYKNFMNQAAHVLSVNPDADPDAPIMVITHSVIRPAFPSTTETADLIWSMTLMNDEAPSDFLGPDCGDCAPKRHLDDLAAVVFEGEGAKIYSNPSRKNFYWKGLADGWYDRRAANNFFVGGWADIRDNDVVTRDPSGNADHIFQGRVVLPELLKEFTVKRWNRDCGHTAGYDGIGRDLGQLSCKPGRGVVYDEGAGGKHDYFPTLPDTSGAGICPPPPPGQVIVGAPGNPCATGPATIPAPRPTPAPGDLPRGPSRYGLRELAMLAAGGAAGYAASRYLLR